MLSDGNDTGSQVAPLRAARIAQERGVRLYLIGVGDAKVAGEESLNEDVSAWHGRPDRRALPARARSGELRAAYQELAELEPVRSSTESYQPKRSVAYLPLFAISLLFALEMAIELGARCARCADRGALRAERAMAELASFHFLRPGLLYWLLPSALYALYLLCAARRRRPGRAAVSPALLPHLLGSAGARKWLLPEGMLLASAVSRPWPLRAPATPHARTAPIQGQPADRGVRAEPEHEPPRPQPDARARALRGSTCCTSGPTRRRRWWWWPAPRMC